MKSASTSARTRSSGPRRTSATRRPATATCSSSRASRENGKPIVYRNEDTGWGWPPYFKFDTSNLQAEASDLSSTKADPVWVAVRHYGWRNEFLSIFPNAVGVKQVAGPDVRLIPWLNIVILLLLAFLIFWIVKIWRQFRERSIDPLLEDAGEAYERVGDHATEHRGQSPALAGQLARAEAPLNHPSRA